MLTTARASASPLTAPPLRRASPEWGRRSGSGGRLPRAVVPPADARRPGLGREAPGEGGGPPRRRIGVDEQGLDQQRQRDRQQRSDGPDEPGPEEQGDEGRRHRQP